MRGSDLFLLLIQGLLIGSVPIALIWSLRGVNRYLRLARVTVFLTFDLIVFGAFTRLTDSGLGCPDWPGCFAKANPFAAAPEITEAAALAPGGPVDMTKAWIEMIHRSLAMGVGLLIVVLVVMSFQTRQRDGRFPLAIASLALVVLQGAFGAWTVTLRLEPVIVTTHLLLALLLLAVLTWQAAWLAPPRAIQARGGGTDGSVFALRAFAGLALLLLVMQIALGGWTSTNYAVLACTDFPRCQGQWVPPMDFADGFTLLRALGHRPDGSFLPYSALVAIHWTHRNMAVVVGSALLLLSFWLFRATSLRIEAKRLALLVGLQIATGLANVLFSWPLLAAVLHNAGAAALVVILVLINYQLRSAPGAAPAAHRSSGFAPS